MNHILWSLSDNLCTRLIGKDRFWPVILTDIWWKNVFNPYYWSSN